MKRLLGDFRDDERGGMMIFIMLMFSVMMVGGGMAVDYINLEYNRESVQDALDRGVLAAVANGNTAGAVTPAELAAAEAEAVATVREYVVAAGYDPDSYGITITPDFTLNSQRVDVTMNYGVDTFFLKMAGIPSLTGRLGSAAKIADDNIEISLVVDISGSMSGGKIADLRVAATGFVDKMLESGRADYTTISLIPFSGQVNAGSNLMANFNYNRWHNYSSCVNFEANDFQSTTISTSASLEQTQHFAPQWIYDANSDWCPRGDLAIVPLSNDATQLHTAINSLRATGMTAGNIGVKWAAALLDPAMQPAVQSLVNLGEIAPQFDNRPAPFDDDETLKIIVFMTDGTNTDQYRVKSGPYQVYTTDAFGLPIPSEDQLNADYWDANRVPWSYSHLQQRVSPGEEDDRLSSICTQAKDSNVVIFTIGYDIPEGGHAENVMTACASTAGYYYPVEALDLDAAFSSIVQTIQKLRLVN